jgi:ribonuclease J
MALNGHVMVTLLLDENDEPLGEAWAELMGLPGIGKTGAALSEIIESELGDFLSRIEDRVLQDDEKLDEAVRRIVRQVAMEEIGKKPEVTVVVSRLQAE